MSVCIQIVQLDCCISGEKPALKSGFFSLTGVAHFSSSSASISFCLCILNLTHDLNVSLIFLQVLLMST